MTKRLSSRLLAVILTIAICATTVAGCLIGANAADPCYAFSSGVFAEDDLTQATIDVTFTAPANLPDGFSAGAFSWEEVDEDDADCLVLKDVAAVTDGVNLANEGDYYLFDLEAAKSSVTFKFTFGFSAGEASLTGKEYKITLNEVELANSDSAYYTESGNAYGTISAGCNHVVTGVGTPLATGVGGDYGYSVYAQSVCTLCGEQFGYQLVPTAESLNDSDANLPTEVDVFEGRTELETKYDKNGDASADASDSANWVLDVEGTPHRTWGYIDADIKLLDETKENSEENPYIIENAEQLFYLVKIGGSKTAGKYYKVKDGIRAFHLNPNVTDETSFEDMMANINNSGPNWDSAAPFQGHFDGNGVIITGIKTTTNHTYSGLFPQIKGNVTIKNVTVMNSYLVGKTAVGGFFGTQIYSSADGVVYDIVVENCAVYQCYMQSTHASTGVGAIGGYVANACNPGTGWLNGNTIINNCYVNLDEDYFISTTETSGTGSHGGAIGYQGSSVMNVTNSIFIGVRPYTARNLTGDKISGNYGWQGAKAQCYDNVYTTHACDDAYNSSGVLQDFTGRIFTLTDAQFKGKDADLNMLTLDWDTVWATTTGYPTLYMPYNRPEVPTNIIYWDGTVATGIAEGTGTKDDPYIINTASELAYLVGLDGNGPETPVTKGKYYKVADGIDTIVLQSKDKARPIMALDSASEVQAYFESGTFTEWVEKGWEQSAFCGTFDGNGATVYGLYTVSTNNAGLFSTIDAGATIKNIAVKNSYLKSTANNYQIGVIAAVTASNTSYGVRAAGTVWFDNCTVANCYIRSGCTTHVRTGIIIGAAQNDAVYIDNCLVYGNDAYYGENYEYAVPLTGIPSSAVVHNESSINPEGLVFESQLQTTGTYANQYLYNNMVRNSIVLGSEVMMTNNTRGYRTNDAGRFENVYTDMSALVDGVITFTNGTFEYAEDQLKKISAADAQGPTASGVLTGLAWNTDWFAGAEGEYPAQSPFVEVGVAKQSNADFTIVGTNIVYENDGSFSLNIHYIPAYEGFAPTMYVGDTNCTKLYILEEPVASSKRTEIGDDTAMMFTLKGISAKNIDKLWHPTLVAKQGASVNWSKSAEISVAKTAEATIVGNYDTADKNVAAAVLMYGDASQAALAETANDYSAGVVDLLEFGSYLTEAGSSSQYYDSVLADNGETGADWDNAIIIDSAEELVYLCKASGNDTDGKYYKVADGIAGFNLSTDKLDINGTLAGKSLTSGKTNLDIVMGSGKNQAGGTPGFQGHFDGNGATVYGAWTNHESISAYAGLFTCTQGDVTIKNINVNKAHFTATAAAGGIIGYYKGEGTNTNNTTLTIENCSVTDSYLEVTKTGYGYGIGAVVGRVDCPSSYTDTNDEDGDSNTTETLYVNNKVIIKNCYVNLDEDNFVSLNEGTSVAGQQVSHGGVVGHMGSNALDVNHCIVIGIKPYATSISSDNNDVQHSGLESHFTNVYTTSDVPITGVYLGGTLTNRNFTGKVIPLTEEQLTGAAAKDNMTALDWNNVWTTTDTYPTFISKDYKAPDSGIIATWDGTVAAGFASGSGTKEDPYIISTAAEFAYMVKDKLVDQAATITVDKYFKVADGISAFVMQKPEYASEIMALGSASDTKAYFEENAANMLKWPNYGWEGSSFCGHFDGNGATVYGLYQTSTNNAGLFSSVDAGAVIQNIGVQNSYLTSSATNYQVAAIAPVSNSSGYGVKQEGIVWVNGCTVANNYMYNACTSWERSGVISGSFGNDIIMIDNCLVYGNDATYGDGVKMALTGVGNNDVETTAKKPDELPSYVENSDFYCNTVRNSIVLDCDVVNTGSGRSHRRNGQNCVSGVYTNGVSGTVTFTNGEFTYEDAQIKAITPDEVKGSAATSIVETLNAAPIGDTVWYVGATGDYPGFKEAGNLSNALQALYDGITFTPDTYNDTGIDLFSLYATSLNLNSNPYMSFAFEFGGELKGKQDQITVTFTYTVNGTEYTYTTTPPASVDADGDGVIDEINNVNGWYNKASAGRFFTYRFKDIPVEALANPIQVSANYNGTDYDLGTVSVGGLGYEFEAQNKLTPSDYYATRIEAVKALLFYTQMIHARYGAQ